MSKKNLRLPETSNIFDLAPIQSLRMPREWVIDWPWIVRIKDDDILKAVTKIKLDYLAKVAVLDAKIADIEHQKTLLDANVTKDLAKTMGI